MVGLNRSESVGWSNVIALLAVLIIMVQSDTAVAQADVASEGADISGSPHGDSTQSPTACRWFACLNDPHLPAYLPRSISMQADEQSPSTRSEKSPLLAFALSWLMPGCGQFYNGDILKGVLQLSGAATGIVIGFAYLEFGKENPTSTMGFVLGIACSLWSMIDAPLSAAAINREIQRQQSTSAARVNPSHRHLLSANGLDGTIMNLAFSFPF